MDQALAVAAAPSRTPEKSPSFPGCWRRRSVPASASRRRAAQPCVSRPKRGSTMSVSDSPRVIVRENNPKGNRVEARSGPKR